MSIKYNRREFLGYSSTVIGTSLLLKACGNNLSSTLTGTGEKEGFKVAIALPGAIADGAWNQSGYEGVELAQKKNGVKTAFVERIAQSDRSEILKIDCK